MNNYRTRLELKSEVKNMLRGQWKKAISLYLIPLVLLLISNGSSNSSSRANVQYDVANFDISSFFHIATSYGIISFILSIIFLLINLSATFRGLDWIEDPKLDFEPFKSNFTYFRSPDWWKLIFLYVLTSIFTALWTLLLIVPGIIKAISYSQTYFVYKDLNDRGQADNYSITDYITKSRQLMTGNKGRYFVLQLSFLGWWIVGFATLGISFIWIYPYYKLTMANFYHDLTENQNII